MPMTIVVTRNTPMRFRGFLASCMCEIGPGIYTAPRMTVAIRDRVWSVLEDWFVPTPEVSVLMTWPDPALPGGQAIQALGIPRQDLREYRGVFLTRRELDPKTLGRHETGQDAETQPADG